MPIMSYLATPAKGEKSGLLSELNQLQYCQAMAAKNRDVIVLVTDTPDSTAETNLQNQLKELSSLQTLSMAYGHVDDKDTIS